MVSSLEEARQIGRSTARAVADSAAGPHGDADLSERELQRLIRRELDLPATAAPGSRSNTDRERLLRAALDAAKKVLPADRAGQE